MRRAASVRRVSGRVTESDGERRDERAEHRAGDRDRGEEPPEPRAASSNDAAVPSAPDDRDHVAVRVARAARSPVL